MHIGIIGVGDMGSFHARTLRDLPSVDHITVADSALDKAKALASQLNATAVSSIDQLINAGVDGLVIATSTPSHSELVQMGIEAQIPVFCEKPISLDIETTGLIIEKARAFKVPVQVGFQRRFDPGYRRARELLQSGALGRIYVVRAVHHVPGPPDESYIALAGGMYRDMHVHDFDIISWVTGQPIVEIYAAGSVLVKDYFRSYDDIDTTVATFRMADGTEGILSGNRNDPLGYDIRMELYGDSDSIVVGWDDRTPLRSAEPNFPEKSYPYYQNYLDRFAQAYRAEMAEFLRVARGEAGSPCTVEEAQESLRVAIAAEKSRREHRPVRVANV